MLRMTTLFFAATMLASSAHAGVVYSWQQVQPSPMTDSRINLELVFSDKAIAGKRLSLDIANDCMQSDDCIDPQDSLLSLRFWHDRKNDDGSYTPMTLIQFGYRERPRYFGDLINLRIDFLDNGLLGGWIRANDGNSDFELSSVGSVFNADRIESDEGNACGVRYPDVCSGELGLLRATANVAEIPEPATPALAGLGLLAAWFARRRRR